MFYVYSTYTRVQPSTPDSAQDAVICSIFNQFVLVFFFGNTEISGFIRHPDTEADVGLQRPPSLSLTLSVHDKAIKLKQKEDTHVLINLSSKCNLIHLRRQRVVTWLFLVELCYPSPKNIDMNVFDKIVKLTTHWESSSIAVASRWRHWDRKRELYTSTILNL